MIILKQKGGFTLVEVIIGILLIGIIALSLIPVFSYSFVNIYSSGNRTDYTYQNQSIIETDQATNPEIDNITFIFEGMNISVDIEVYEVGNELNNDGSNASITFFKFK